MAYYFQSDLSIPGAACYNKFAFRVTPNTPQGYPYIRFNVPDNTEPGTRGAVLVLDLCKTKWYQELEQALATLVDLTGHRTNYGSIAVYAITLAE